MKTTKILSLVLALMLAFGSFGVLAEATYERAVRARIDEQQA